MIFPDVTLCALIDSGALGNCLSETEYNKIQQLSPKDNIKVMDPPPFKLQVYNGDIETPKNHIDPLRKRILVFQRNNHRRQKNHWAHTRPHNPQEQQRLSRFEPRAVTPRHLTYFKQTRRKH